MAIVCKLERTHSTSQPSSGFASPMTDVLAPSCGTTDLEYRARWTCQSRLLNLISALADYALQ